MSYAIARNRETNSEVNKIHEEDRAIHDWYRFVLSFPPHLVRTYLQRFELQSHHRVLDPFCGTGTVLVECKRLGIPSIGIDANPMAYLASQTKVDWTPEPQQLLTHALSIAEATTIALQAEGIEDESFFHRAEDTQLSQLTSLPEDQFHLLLTNSISPLPLHKTLTLLENIERYRDDRFYPHERLALTKALVHTISNLRFGPEVGIGPAKYDAPVVASWLRNIRTMVKDIALMPQKEHADSKVFCADARQLSQVLTPNSIDAVITSPPYPNEKDYTRTTRLESVVLGLLNNKTDLQSLKRGLLRSNTRNVYKGDTDDQWVSSHPEIQHIAQAIEARRIELDKTSGFERLYAKVTTLYFGGIARHLASLYPVLRPGAQLAYVLGDQASYLQVMIPTGRLVAEIAQSLGYELVGIDLFRTRFATATKVQLREEVVVLRRK